MMLPITPIAPPIQYFIFWPKRVLKKQLLFMGILKKFLKRILKLCIDWVWRKYGGFWLGVCRIRFLTTSSQVWPRHPERSEGSPPQWQDACEKRSNLLDFFISLSKYPWSPQQIPRTFFNKNQGVVVKKCSKS